MADQGVLRKKINFDSSSLPSLPAAAVQVLQLTMDPQASADNLAQVIGQDPALSAKILRAVNSPFYGLKQKVSSLSQAVALLGLNTVRTLALSFSLVCTLQGGKNRSFNHMKYWRRSMYAATASRVLAEHVMAYKVEECFMAGLLMDIGMLVLEQALGEHYDHVVERARSHCELPTVEMQNLGLTHAQVSGQLGRHWHLPDVLAVPMANHHSPQAVDDEILKQVTQIVWLAGRCADVFMEENCAAESIAAVRGACRELFYIDEVACDGMLCTIGLKTAELAELFEVRLNTSTDYEHILAKASTRLLELAIGQQCASSPKDKRRAPRIQRDGKMTIVPCVRGALLKPRVLNLKDISACGLGLVDAQPMEVGSQFIVRLPQQSGGSLTLLYTVRRCDPTADLYTIGAELTSVLRPENAKKGKSANQAQTPAQTSA